MLFHTWAWTSARQLDRLEPNKQWPLQRLAHHLPITHDSEYLPKVVRGGTNYKPVTLMHEGNEGYAVWSKLTEGLLWSTKSQKMLMMVTWGMCQQFITPCCVGGCRGLHLTTSKTWRVYCWCCGARYLRTPSWGVACLGILVLGMLAGRHNVLAHGWIVLQS